MGKIFKAKTADATSTPIVSGGASANANSVALITPAGFSKVRVSCAGAFKWGDNALLDGNTAGGFMLEQANTAVEIPVSGVKTLTLKTSSGSAAQFYFAYLAEAND